MTTNSVTGDRISTKLGDADAQRRFNENFDRIFTCYACPDCGKTISSGMIHTCSPQVKESSK